MTAIEMAVVRCAAFGCTVDHNASPLEEITMEKEVERELSERYETGGIEKALDALILAARDVELELHVGEDADVAERRTVLTYARASVLSLFRKVETDLATTEGNAGSREFEEALGKLVEICQRPVVPHHPLCDGYPGACDGCIAEAAEYEEYSAARENLLRLHRELEAERDEHKNKSREKDFRIEALDRSVAGAQEKFGILRKAIGSTAPTAEEVLAQVLNKLAEISRLTKLGDDYYHTREEPNDD